MRRQFFNVVLLVGLVLATACSTGSRQDVASDSSDTPLTQAPDLNLETSALDETARSEVPPALAVLDRSTITGEVFEPSSLAGNEVLLWFWAPW
ncbi:MAG: hypothetical protein MB55_05890 [marine actinobacterium MedAcidi-G3]|nr:MAG: hypothetical protein MB55_05890 [marine actinobacterium MedAcidi-G3]MAR54169.1 hypothetical protein [Acidimicrobiaceae bacterium]HCJ86329.1 hypothetical protein [Acidimicrobiaceae bacterium]